MKREPCMFVNNNTTLQTAINWFRTLLIYILQLLGLAYTYRLLLLYPPCIFVIHSLMFLHKTN